MKQIKILLLLILSFSFHAFSQKANELNQTSNLPEYYIGFDTHKTNNFNEILENLQNTKGITVLSYCNSNNIIKISFSKKNFSELKSIFNMVEKNFYNVTCYQKNYSDKLYQNLCYEELAKINIGGIN